MSIVAGELVWIEKSGTNPPDVLVPSEYAPVFAVDLPLAQHRMRVAAVPYALEDRVSQQLGELHVALGSEISPRRYLAAVVSRTRMAGWRCSLAANNVAPHRLIPDAVTLPEPVGAFEVMAWTIKVAGERVLIRTSGHEAFATSTGLFETLWSAAGQPTLQQVGDEPLPGLFSVSVHPACGSSMALGGDVVDLQQGVQQSARRSFEIPLKMAAAIVVTAALAHTAILAADAAFVSGGVAQRRTEAARVLAAIAPLAQPGDDPGATLEAILPNGSQGSGTSRFLSLLARVSSSIQPVASGVTTQALSFDEADGALLLKIEAGDLPALERVQQSLSDAGFSAQSGGASVEDGGAESSITVRDEQGPEKLGNGP